MKFFVSKLDRLRRSAKAGDESSDRIAMVRIDHDTMCDQFRGDISTSDIIVTKDPRRMTVAIGSGALSDISKARDLGKQLVQLLELETPSLMLIDLRHVGQLSSESLNQLIVVNCHARSLGIQLVLANLSETLSEVFRVTRLDRLFDLADPA